jgi:hypothetical protein
MTETERYTATFHVLLSHRDRHLRDIDVRTLRTCGDHMLDRCPPSGSSEHMDQSRRERGSALERPTLE